MQFTKTENNVYEECRLRRVERNYNASGNPRKLDDWHFKLKDHVDPYHIYNILGMARWNRELQAIVFPNNKQGIVWRNFCKERLYQDIEAAMGEQRYVLEGEKLVKMLTKGETLLMLDLTRKILMGQNVDSHAELARYRGRAA